MSINNPTLIIFAGANGSGKTTAARQLLPKLKIKEFVNADEMAKGLSPFNPSGQALAAGRLVLDRISHFIDGRKNFAIETTLLRRRYWRSLQNLYSPYFELCDSVIIYDTTSGELQPFGEKEGRDILVSHDETLTQSFFEKLKDALARTKDTSR